MFWEETTKQAIGWGEIWESFQPISKPGQRYRRTVRPFLQGQHAAWQEAMQDWQTVCAVGDADWEKNCRDELQRLPDLPPLLTLLRQQASLRVVDVFELKTFLWHGRLLQELKEQKKLELPWWPTFDWAAFLRLLNPSGDLQPTFSLRDLGDEELNRLQDDLQRVESELYLVKKEQSDRLRATYGRAPTRDGLYVFERRQVEAIQRAEQDAELQLQGVNVFEAVFAVVDPPLVEAKRQERELLVTRIEDREIEVLQALVAQLMPHVEKWEAAYDACGRLDWAFAKVQVAQKWNACAAQWIGEAEGGVESGADDWGTQSSEKEMLPNRSADHRAPWQVRQGFHPLARSGVESRGGMFTPLDLTLRPGVGLITGPNMGGKTVVLKTLGLLQALAQHALPVPAAAFHFHPVERIGWSGGDEQSLVSGLSSFGAEMQRLASLLENPPPALLLLDEVARTTNPEEGEALAIGLATYLQKSGHTALLATHFPGVTQVPGLQGYRVAGLRQDVLTEWTMKSSPVDPERLLGDLHRAMDYRLLPADGQEFPRDALRIAELFGLPEELLTTSRQVFDRKEGH